MPDAPPTRPIDIIRLLFARFARVVLWGVAVGLVGGGYSLLWQPLGLALDFSDVSWHALVGVCMVGGGGILGGLLALTMR